MDKNFRIRLGICFLLLSTLGAGVLFRAAYLMLVPSERLATAMNRQFRQEPPRMPRRGYILDRNREPIAVSMDVKSLFANPSKAANKAKIASWLASALNMKSQPILAKLKSDKGFVWIKRQLTENEQSAIEDLLEKHPTLQLSLGLSKEAKRFYPNQSLASQLIGFTGLDQNGLEGVELYYEKSLAGDPNSSKKADGQSLVLTIDKTLQYTLEEELARGMKDTGAKAATAIVMNAENGDIIAMASQPTFNANQFSSSSPEARRNRALTDLYEPGSTIKPLLAAGAIEDKIVTPQSRFFCEHGKLQIGKHWVKEAEAKDKWGWLSVSEILRKSSNIGATKLGFLYGPQRTYNWYKRLEIAEKTGVDLSGEATGQLVRPEKWSKIAHSNISFGQGLLVTPLQMIRAYAALANGGFLVTPRLVKQFYTFEGEFSQELPVGPRKKVMEATTVEQVKQMLSGVATEDGTAPKAAVPGFVVIGKTGTAQKAITGQGYKTGKYMASFIGFVKGMKPNYVTLVVVDEPKFPFFGGEAAAPIFRRIMTAALAREGVSPNPNLIPLNTIGKESRPKIQEKVVTVSAAPAPLVSMVGEEDHWIMPDLKGITARDVLDYFSDKNFQVRIKGTGLVVEQFPKAGTALKSGDSVAIRLARDKTL